MKVSWPRAEPMKAAPQGTRAFLRKPLSKCSLWYVPKWCAPNTSRKSTTGQALYYAFYSYEPI